MSHPSTNGHRGFRWRSQLVSSFTHPYYITYGTRKGSKIRTCVRYWPIKRSFVCKNYMWIFSFFFFFFISENRKLGHDAFIWTIDSREWTLATNILSAEKHTILSVRSIYRLEFNFFVLRFKTREQPNVSWSFLFFFFFSPPQMPLIETLPFNSDRNLFFNI